MRGGEHVGGDDLVSARVVVAIAAVAEAVAALDGVGEDAAIRGAAGGGQVAARPAAREERVELREGDAGLDANVAERLVELRDRGEPRELHRRGDAAPRAVGAVAVVPAAAEHVHREAMLARDAEAGRDLVDGAGAQVDQDLARDREGAALQPGARVGRVVHPGLAQERAPSRDRRGGVAGDGVGDIELDDHRRFPFWSGRKRGSTRLHRLGSRVTWRLVSRRHTRHRVVRGPRAAATSA